MRAWPAPRTSAAFTNSRSDQAIVLARAMRPMSGTVTMARAAMITPDLRPFETFCSALANMATSDSASTRAGIDSSTLNSGGEHGVDLAPEVAGQQAEQPADARSPISTADDADPSEARAPKIDPGEHVAAVAVAAERVAGLDRADAARSRGSSRRGREAAARGASTARSGDAAQPQDREPADEPEALGRAGLDGLGGASRRRRRRVRAPRALGGARDATDGRRDGQLRARAWRIRGSTTVYRMSTAKFTRT